MTTPDLTHITGLLLTKALKSLPELTDDDGVRWSLSDEGSPLASIWRADPATDEWRKFAYVSLTVNVQPRSAVVVGGVVYTGEEGA